MTNQSVWRGRAIQPSSTLPLLSFPSLQLLHPLFFFFLSFFFKKKTILKYQFNGILYTPPYDPPCFPHSCSKHTFLVWFCFALLPLHSRSLFLFLFCLVVGERTVLFVLCCYISPFSITHRTLELDFRVPFHSLSIFLFLPPPFLSFALYSPSFTPSIPLFLAFSCFSCFFCFSFSPSLNFLKVILR